ncbi:MAG: hypothetical protein O7G85_17200, partial [Planctomycetota bacterium]|nr:hypothetical protein [Planctomycetota bacterium]
MVRDFTRSHPDFNVIPSGGYGHFAGNISLNLGATQSPTLVGSGFRVTTQWQDQLNQPIAPHMFMNANVIAIGSTPVRAFDVTIDVWDSSQGPFISQIPGPEPGYNYNAPMPILSEPSPFPASTGNAFFNKAGNGNPANTITSDIHCNSFSVQGAKSTDLIGTVLVIDGDVTILVENDFELSKKAHINFTAGSSLTIYVKDLFKVSQESAINMLAEDPTRFTVYNLGTTQMKINQGSAVCGNFYSPNATLHLAQDDQFYGKYLGTGLILDQDSGFHWDTSPYRDSCNNTVIDLRGTAGILSTGGITDATTFSHWFQDFLGVNLSMIHSIDMVRNGDGVYQALITEFHPIDDRLLGNEGDAHNFYFTFELQANFIYRSCQNKFFRFNGSDDAWLFID